MKSRFKTWMLLLLFLSSSSCDTYNYRLIQDYLQWNNIKITLFLTCERSNWTEDKSIIANFRNNGIWTNHWNVSRESNLSNFDYHRFLLRTGYPICVVVDWDCSETKSILKEISKRKMFHYERHWLMFGVDAEKMFNVLSEESINIDAEVAIAVPVGKAEYEIKDVYNPSCKRGGRFKMDIVGSWSQSVGLNIFETKSKFDRRHNFAGTTFLAEITIPKLPANKTFMEHINSDDFPFIDTKERGNYRVYQILQEMFNFKVVIRRGKIWGARKPDGYWIGVVGSLNRSEIDLSLSSLRWENDRYELLDQTTDTFYINNVFIFRHPSTVDSIEVFLKPFDGLVWWSIVGCAVFFSIFIRNLLILTHEFRTINMTGYNSTENDFSYNNSFLMVFGILFQQGYVGSVLFTSSRIIALTVLMLSLLIYQFYCSFIVGSLLTEQPKTIKTMKQLSHSQLDLAMDELPYIQDIFHYNTEQSAVEMYNKIMKQPRPLLPLHKGLDLVKDGSLAFNTDGLNAYPILKSLLTDSEICDLQEVKYVEKIPTGPGLPRKSPLRELIKIGIRKLYETGILSHLRSIWIACLPKCSHSDVDVKPVDMVHVSSAWFVLGLGMQISICAFMGELIQTWCLKRIPLCKTPRTN